MFQVDYDVDEVYGVAACVSVKLWIWKKLSVYLWADGEELRHVTDFILKFCVIFSDWVMQLGEVRSYTVLNEAYEEEERDYYSYSLVTDKRRLAMFVLVRDVAEFREEFQEEALEFLYANGFDSPVNNPIECYHEDDCQYADPNPPFTC